MPSIYDKPTYNCVGFKPYSYQRAVIDETINQGKSGKTVCVLSSRQKGKSLMIANILLWYALNYKMSKSFCVSPTLKQAKNIFDTILNAVQGTPVFRSANANDLVIRFLNASNIHFKSAEQKENLRGYTVNSFGLLCIDEAAYISDDVFNIILPWVDAHKSPILMCSTPFIRQGFFYRYYNYGLNNEHNTVSINWSDPKFKKDIEKVMPPERLEEYRQMLPKNVFKTEYLGEFLDDDGMVFIGFRNILRNNEIKPNDKLYCGIDWSNQGGNDYTVLSMFNDNGEQVYLRYWNDLTPSTQVEEIGRIINEIVKDKKVRVVIEPELNSIGTPYTDLLNNCLQIRNSIKGFLTTNQSKNELVTNFQVAIEQNKITLLNDPFQVEQLSYFTQEINPRTRNVTYNAPVGLHDDIVMADMLAYDCYLKNHRSGNRMYPTR